jgi:hypothetical protein
MTKRIETIRVDEIGQRMLQYPPMQGYVYRIDTKECCIYEPDTSETAFPVNSMHVATHLGGSSFLTTQHALVVVDTDECVLTIEGWFPNERSL